MMLYLLAAKTGQAKSGGLGDMNRGTAIDDPGVAGRSGILGAQQIEQVGRGRHRCPDIRS